MPLIGGSNDLESANPVTLTVLDPMESSGYSKGFWEYQRPSQVAEYVDIVD